MPYAGPGDPALPANVKKLPQAKRAQWVGVFNSTMERCVAGKMKPGPGEKPGEMDCESRAFRMANGVAAKELGVEPVGLDELLQLFSDGAEADVKMGDMAPVVPEPSAVPVRVVESDAPYRPYGGATSFGDLKKYRQASKVESAVGELNHAYRCIVDNIFANCEMELTDKAAAVVAASEELAVLLDTPDASLLKLGMKAEAGEREVSTPLSWLRSGLRRLLGVKEEPSMNGSAFFSFKDRTGQWRWLALHSNKFLDREGEVITEQAHKDYVAAAEKLDALPELWLWHTPLTAIGWADFVDYVDGFMVSSGPYALGMDEVAEKLAEDAPTLGVSHGYRYPLEAKENGVIHRYWTFEVSPLPRERAANSWQPLNGWLAKEGKMGMRPMKRTFLARYLGDEKVTALAEKLERFSKELEEAGIDWKEIEDALAAAAAEPDPKSEPEPEPEGDDGEGDGEPAQVTADLGARVERLETAVGTVADAVKEVLAEVKELKRTDDERFSDLASPRRPAPGDPDARPSQAAATVVDIEKIAGLKEALADDAELPVNPARKFVGQLLGKEG